MSYIASTEFFHEVSKGNVQGSSALIVNGHNEDIDSGASEDLWVQGGLISYLSAAETMNIVSTDANDTSAGTGARTVFVEGLDATYNEISETVTMNGLTNVLTVNSYLRVLRLTVVTVGTGLVNAGTITATASTAATVQCTMHIDSSLSESCITTVPAGKTGYVIHADFNTTKTTGGTNPVVRFEGRIRTNGGPWKTVFDVKLDTSVDTSADKWQPVQVPLPEQTDIRVEVTTDQNNTEVFGRLFMILVND